MALVLDTPYAATMVTAQRARKPHRCEWCRKSAIAAGDVYVTWIEFPGGDAGYADSAGHPVRLNVCIDCEHEDRRWLILAELELGSAIR